jgi:hypothetical protein
MQKRHIKRVSAVAIAISQPQVDNLSTTIPYTTLTCKRPIKNNQNKDDHVGTG